MKMHHAAFGIALILTCAIALPLPAAAQVYNPYNHLVRVNSDYYPDEAGNYYAVRNRNGHVYNFSIVGSDGIRRPIPMADPTVLPLTGSDGVTWYYITGTCDSIDTSNFLIYKTRDFVEFYPHMTVWPESRRGNSGTGRELDVLKNLTNPSGSTQTYITFPSCDPSHVECNDHTACGSGQQLELSGLWAPHLYIDPREGSTPQVIRMSFTARHGRHYWLPVCYDDGSYRYHEVARTCWYTEIPISAFLISLESRSQSTSSHWFSYPLAYTHLENYYNQTSTPRDGGASLGTSVADSVAMSGARNFGTVGTTQRGTVPRVPFGTNPIPYFREMDPRAWMLHDSFVYHQLSDPSDPQSLLERWIIYTAEVGGLNITAFRLADNSFDGWRTSASHKGQFMTLANPQSTYHAPSAGVPNGSLSAELCALQFGVAEAPAVFVWPQPATEASRTYVIFSRNPANGPAYGMYYRMSEPGGGLASLAISPNDDPQEYALLQSAVRNRTASTSYGHGEVFVVSANGTTRPYLVYHAKEDGFLMPGNSIDCNDNDEPFYHPIMNSYFPNRAPRLSGRTVYFKELYVVPETHPNPAYRGRLSFVPIRNDTTQVTIDSEIFLVPSSLVSLPGCDPDFNGDGIVDQDDIAALADVVAGGDCP